jgi:Uma2 family endonuclease
MGTGGVHVFFHPCFRLHRCTGRPLCPDLVVELASPSDDTPQGLADRRRKMAAYQANGAQLGWLLLPQQRAVEIWPQSGPSTRLEEAAVLQAGPQFPGLQLDLSEIWAG